MFFCGHYSPLEQSIGNAHLVAAQLAHLIKRLKRPRSFRCKDVYMIGFSIGASIAGLARIRLKADVSCRPQRTTDEKVLRSLNGFWVYL